MEETLKRRIRFSKCKVLGKLERERKKEIRKRKTEEKTISEVE